MKNKTLTTDKSFLTFLHTPAYHLLHKKTFSLQTVDDLWGSQTSRPVKVGKLLWMELKINIWFDYE